MRKEAAERFAAAVTEELSALAMPHAKITVPVMPQDEYGPHGADEVEIRLAAHPGAPALSLAKGASGGELSRVMLAIEVVFAGADPVPTFVFDEVDAGVGGKAAVEIGRRLARLARRAQVIVVTHLPQVAAFADTHLVVEKASDGSVVSSGISRLDDAAGSGNCPGCWPGSRTPSTARRTPVSFSPPRERSAPARSPGRADPGVILGQCVRDRHGPAARPVLRSGLVRHAHAGAAAPAGGDGQ